MSDLVEVSHPVLPCPLPRTDVTIRPGVLGDIPFMDALQKRHSKQVGWMPTKQFEGKIKLGHVLVAEVAGERVGYCIGNDQYFKRDDVGIIYQMNVMPGRQRGLVGASLLKAQFERSAWGCKLYCCWCAQDIAANRFWEAMGFVPLAFRAGSEKKSRVHIFWQKRIRQGDVTTPWWFPSKTGAGAMREDRIALPIPPGTHWSDAKPLIFPQTEDETAGRPAALPGPQASRTRATRAKKEKPSADVVPPAAVRRNGLTFDIPQPGESLPPVVPTDTALAKAASLTSKKASTGRVKRVCDPRWVAAARELRDRWSEQVNGGGADAALSVGCGKYDVCRAVDAGMRIELIDAPALPAPVAA